MLPGLGDFRIPFKRSDDSWSMCCMCVSRADSAQDASSHVSAVAQSVLYEFDVF